VGCWEARAIWRKLDCLNPNLQSVQSEHPPERRPKTGAMLCADVSTPSAQPRSVGRCPARAFKEMNGTPKSCYHVHQGRTWDRLRDASPMATECP
jgi:hypothetical protein